MEPNSRLEPASQIEAQSGEEIVSIEDHGAYTSVVKRQDCAEGCKECPHGPYLYHVTLEEQIEGKKKLHWTYLGEVQ